MKLFLILVVLLLLPLALAQSGCILDKENPFYCQDKEETEAMKICNYFGDCVYQKGQSCSAFPECQKVLCKSFCQETYFGLCTAGEVPAGEQEQWCMPGCCQFSYYNTSFCSSEPSQWHCEIAAENREASEYRFLPALAKDNCNAVCQGEQRLAAEEIPLAQSGKNKTTLSIPSPQKSLWGWIVVVLVFLAALAFFWLHRQEKKKLPPAEKKRPWYFPFPIPSWRKAKIEYLKKQHQRKVRHGHREEFFAEHGLLAEHKKKDDFEQLDLLKKGKLPEQDDDVFGKLEELGK